MTDIAKAVGVSQAAVSYVLNDKPQSQLIRPETRARILKEAKRLRYTPHSGARSMRLNKSETLCVIISTSSLNLPDEVSAAPVLMGVCSQSAKQGYRVLIEASPAGGTRDVNSLEKLIFSRQCDGVILMGPMHRDPRAELLRELQFPAVFIGRSESQALDTVDCDNVEVGYDLTRHLLEQGRTRIAMITGDTDYLYHEDRLTGYRRALREAGIQPKKSLEIALPESWREEADDHSVAAALDRLWKLKNPPDALISGNDDQLASTLMRNLQKRGFSIPNDVAIAGINNSLLSRELHPSLTSVDLHFSTLGHEAARLLIDRIQNPDHSAEHLVIPHSLVIRESSRK